ncbi:MAG: sigma-54-dependent Fis family transcriptional regulator, partial [Candidatus Aminicenantes bacterium]
LAMQVKLLRVLQDKTICMVGSRRTQKVDIRILAATNKDLLGLVKTGLFREDLYYRLNVINIDIPALRDRGDDILLLIQHFAAKYARESHKPVPQFSHSALRVLKSFNWPGNVRELENIIHRLVIMNEEDIIDVPDLPSLMRSPINLTPGLNRTLAEVEAAHIRNVLASVKGNKTRAAKILGIDRKTLREKLKNVSNS